MTGISINQNENNGFDVSLFSNDIAIEDSEGYKTVIFCDQNNNKVSIQMSEFDFNILAERFASYIKSDKITLSNAEKEDSYRKQVKYFSYYSDRSIQMILREIQSDTLIDFMWYMKDANIIQKILANMSQRASEMILEDLQVKWSNINPDNCPIANAKNGREAVKELNKIINMLTKEGQIENFEEEDDENE